MEILEKGLITSMIINKSNNWLAWFLEFDVNYNKKKRIIHVYRVWYQTIDETITICVFIRIIDLTSGIVNNRHVCFYARV